MNTKVSFFRTKYVRVIALILALLWMGVIFSFSSKEAAESSKESISVSFQIVDKTSTVLGLGWDQDKIQSVAQSIEKAVRKIAHMTEYAILSVLWGIALDVWAVGKKPWITIILCVAYAASDEYHQTFVPGRTGKFTDVLIDLCGIVIGYLFIALIVRGVRKRK